MNPLSRLSPPLMLRNRILLLLLLPAAAQAQEARVDSVFARLGAPEMTPLSDARFRVSRSQMLFTGAGRAPFRLFAADGDTLSFVPADEAPPADPAALAGEYRSDEAEATYTVAVRDGRPVLLRRPDAELALTPAYADAFTTPQGWLVRFHRDPAGGVAALSLGMARVRELRFERVR